jgi:Na+/H+ antiporter NhaD/arsenite permease-like protein
MMIRLIVGLVALAAVVCSAAADIGTVISFARILIDIGGVRKITLQEINR